MGKESESMAGKLKYEAALIRLQEIADLLENGETPLEEAVQLFEEGSKLSAFCYQLLRKAEQKVVQLTQGEEQA